MRAILTNLTASLLFIHTVFGCCWRHAHDCDHCAAEVPQSTGLALGCCGGDQEEQDEPAQCPCKFECHGVCTYLRPEKTTIEGSTSIASLDLVGVLPSRIAAEPCGAAGWAQPHRSPVLIGSLRLHLLNRILLI